MWVHLLHSKHFCRRFHDDLFKLLSDFSPYFKMANYRPNHECYTPPAVFCLQCLIFFGLRQLFLGKSCSNTSSVTYTMKMCEAKKYFWVADLHLPSTSIQHSVLGILIFTSSYFTTLASLVNNFQFLFIMC